METFFPRENPLYATYAFYAALLVWKVIFMALITARHRFGKRIFANPEDAAFLKGRKIIFNDDDVERSRRAHLNDLENIPAFLFVSFLYILTSPNESFALLLFRIFTAARFIHSFAYTIRPTQPLRAIVFIVGQLVTTYMIINVLIFFSH